MDITQVSEILHIKADTLVDALPASLQPRTTYAASLDADPVADIAKQFVDSLIGKTGREAFIYAGFE